MRRAKRIGILGSTGSIGTQALDIIGQRREAYDIAFLSCEKRVDIMAEQIIKFEPKAVSVGDEKARLELIDRLESRGCEKLPEILVGKEGLSQLASMECDLVLNSLVGISGLAPTVSAILAGSDIALANKETLVSGGQLVMELARQRGVKITPVDSEHSAIYQCLKGSSRSEVRRILLTGSGGPFRGRTIDELRDVSVEEALAHPNWSMGAKITIDSATLMNKGLEFIEAAWLFNLKPDEIKVIIHPQSIIHSMVEYADGAVMAQLAMPDMREPIAYAIDDERRREFGGDYLDFASLGSGLTFEDPDLETFRCLGLAIEASKRGGSYPVVLNAANEVLVHSFLDGEIAFLNIQGLVEEILEEHSERRVESLEEILQLDSEIRLKTREKILKIRG